MASVMVPNPAVFTKRLGTSRFTWFSALKNSPRVSSLILSRHGKGPHDGRIEGLHPRAIDGIAPHVAEGVRRRGREGTPD